MTDPFYEELGGPIGTAQLYSPTICHCEKGVFEGFARENADVAIF